MPDTDGSGYVDKPNKNNEAAADSPTTSSPTKRLDNMIADMLGQIGNGDRIDGDGAPMQERLKAGNFHIAGFLRRGRLPDPWFLR